MRLQMMLMRKEMEDGFKEAEEDYAKEFVLGDCDWTYTIADGGGGGIGGSINTDYI
jgi:hypothetical protein